jgi:oxalate decarboxylase
MGKPLIILCALFGVILPMVDGDGAITGSSSFLASVSPKAPRSPQAYRLETKKNAPYSIPNVANAWIVKKNVFPALDGITSYVLEVYDESMRLPHWHPNASELGYVVSGSLEVILWRSPGETAIFTLTAGMCWFIPQAALHSLNNIGDEKAVLLVGFSADTPQDIDLPVAFNGVPVPVRDAYTSPHTELKNFKGPLSNPLFGKAAVDPALKNLKIGSPYGFDLNAVPPLFSDPELGTVAWGIQDNWPILENMSVLRARLKPHTARDVIWYPDVGTLYIVTQGRGEFHLIMADMPPQPIPVAPFDYVFIPMGMLHTFLNTSPSEDLEVVAFFNGANPLPEVSLSVSAAFFPESIRNAALTQYGSQQLTGSPLSHLKFNTSSPYLLPINRGDKKAEKR